MWWKWWNETVQETETEEENVSRFPFHAYLRRKQQHAGFCCLQQGVA